MDKLQVVSINARGLNTSEKRIKFYDWLRDTNIDIVFLQETHYVEKNEVTYNARWFGKSVHNYSDSTFSRGVSILFKKDLPIEILNVHKSVDGRKLLVNVKYEESVFTIVNVYAPNNEDARIEFFKRLKTFICQHSVNVNNVTLCGDFNCKLDCKNDKSARKLHDILHMLDLKDIWRTIHNDLSGYTWCDGNNVPFSRIDYVFVSKQFFLTVDKIIIRRIPGSHSGGRRMSDHRVLKFTFKMSLNKRGSGYWKLNCSLIENDDYKMKIKELVEEVNGQNTDAVQKWEDFKIKVREFSIIFSKKDQCNLKSKINFIETQINKIEESDSNEMDMNKKRALEAELCELYDKKCKGAEVRSRSRWMREGEKNSKYFFDLEKQHQCNNVIKELTTVDNRHVHTNNDILGEMCKFYEELYTSKSVDDNDIDNYLYTLDLDNILSQAEKYFCDQFPSIEECGVAVNNLKCNKSPGLDGLTSEFYKTFWDDIKILFYSALKQIFENKEMSFSQRLAIMTLIHKKGDKKLLKNYRPISLTNIDYKIIAFVFAKRLQNILDRLISKSQTAYIKGRFIGENARIILDIFEYCEN